jgi:hypothetical protein
MSRPCHISIVLVYHTHHVTVFIPIASELNRKASRSAADMKAKVTAKQQQQDHPRQQQQQRLQKKKRKSCR